MSGKLLKLEELSAPQVDKLIRDQTAFFLPVSPLEGHGPHLPLGVDYFDAIYFSEIIARIVLQKRPDFDAVICPPIPVGTQVYRQPGSLRLDSRTVFRLVSGVGESLATWGFKYIFLLSGHGSPKHIVAIESACLKVSRKHHIEMHSLSGAMAVRFLRGEFTDKISGLLSKPLTDEEKSILKSDIHGGWWETSMMLLLRPELVGSGYKNLPESKQIKGGKGIRPGYFGMPSLASREFAEKSLQVMTEEATNIIENIFGGRHQKAETVSPLHKIIILRPNFILGTIIILLAILIMTLVAIIVFHS
jgi:creatinine amidohydrolase